MKKIVFYGDSNTYGYDPRGFFEMRYPKECRWTSIVTNHFAGEYEIREEGQNGRCLPDVDREENFLHNLTKDLQKEDALVVMLGTNDILLTSHPDFKAAIERMHKLLNWLKKNALLSRVIVIGPVPISDTPEELRIYHEASIRMNEGFSQVCKSCEVEFYDATTWNIPLAYDGVHFSEEGCIRFAEKMIEVLENKD